MIDVLIRSIFNF
jgi:hypothetical protein